MTEFERPKPNIPAAPSGPSKGMEGIKLRIILADDEDFNADITARSLRKMGHTVDVVKSGQLLLERLKVGGYNFAVIDMQMPEMSGMEALSSIRADSELSKIPVVVYSGTGDVNQSKVNALGAAYLIKPFKREELATAVAEALEKVGK